MLKNCVDNGQHVGIPTMDLPKTIEFYKHLGFSLEGEFPNGNDTCAFLRLGNLMIETWTVATSSQQAGAINHIALNTSNIKQAFIDARQEGYDIVESEVQSIKSFWNNGIKYFDIVGPNKETIEICQINELND